jgi:hypothetical protein
LTVPVEERLVDYEKHVPSVLGAAFLLQAIGSAVSGLFLAPVDLMSTPASGDMANLLADIAAGASSLRLSMLGEVVTAIGIVMLGALMFEVLRGHGRAVARVAFSLYLVEAALLTVREIWVFALLRVGQESLAAGNPA